MFYLINFKLNVWFFFQLNDIFFFFPEQNDPCRDTVCGFGARCVVAPDGHNASCVCPDECTNVNGHDGNSQTVCGSDGIDYKNQCEMNKAACTTNKNITIMFKGKCGKFLSAF